MVGCVDQEERRDSGRTSLADVWSARAASEGGRPEWSEPRACLTNGVGVDEPRLPNKAPIGAPSGQVDLDLAGFPQFTPLLLARSTGSVAVTRAKVAHFRCAMCTKIETQHFCTTRYEDRLGMSRKLPLLALFLIGLHAGEVLF